MGFFEARENLIWLGKTGDQRPEEKTSIFFEKTEMNVDRAQTSDRSIKPIIVEFPVEVLNSSHSCVPISLWLT